MKRPLGEPERWSDRALETATPRRFRAPAEDDLGALFRRVREATLPPPLDRRGAATARAHGPRWGRLVARLALAVIVVAASGGAVKAARAVWRAMAPHPQSLVVPSGSSAVLNRRAHRKLTVVGPARLDLDRVDADRLDVTLEGGALTVEAGDEPLLVAANGLDVTMPAGASGRMAGASGALPAVDALAGELRVAAAASRPAMELQAGHRWPEPPPLVPRTPEPTAAVARAEPPVVPATSALRRQEGARPGARGNEEAADSEASLLARAFHATRVDRDGDGALRALDERERRFPNGALASEARVARVEALLALGRTSEALPLLLEMRDQSQGLTRGIQLARAEILAEQNQCREAIADFDELVAAEVRDDADERARYGRAACHLRANETAPARRDLERYAELYPEGRFIAAVRRAARDLGPTARP